MREGGTVRLLHPTPVVGARARLRCGSAIADPEAGGRPGQDGPARCGQSGAVACCSHIPGVLARPALGTTFTDVSLTRDSRRTSKSIVIAGNICYRQPVSGLTRPELSSRSSLFWRLSFHANRSAAGIPAAELAELATKNSRAAAVAPLEEVATAGSPRSPRQRSAEE
jgi:hypothetical protein